MASILTSLGRTVLAGFVLLVLIIILFGSSNIGNPGWISFVFRYLHVISGVMWIGLLWYFNFVQIPSMPKIPDEQKPAIGKVIAPTALFWFRFAAMATVLTGIYPGDSEWLRPSSFYLATAFPCNWSWHVDCPHHGI